MCVYTKIGGSSALVMVEIWEKDIRVKSGMFGQTAKFGQRSCLFHA